MNLTRRNAWVAVALCALAMTWGCGKKDGDGATGEKPQAQQKKEAPKLVAPAEVLFYGGTESASAMLGGLHKLASQVMPGAPDLSTGLTGALQNQLRLKTPDALDLGKPMRFAGFDPKKVKAGESAAILIGTKGKDALEKALPDDKKAGEQGDAFVVPPIGGTGPSSFVNFLGDTLVITPEAGLFGKHKAFFEALVATKVTDEAFAVVFPMKHVMTTFGAEFDQAIAQAKQQMQQVAQMQAQAQPGAADQMKFITDIIDWAGKSARQLETARITLGLPGDGGLLAVRLTPQKGTELVKTFGSLQGGQVDLVSKLATDAVFLMTASIDPDKSGPMMDFVTTTLMQTMFGGDAAAAKPYTDAMVDFLKGTSGKMAVAAVGAPSGTGLAMVSMMGVRDAAKVRNGTAQMAKMTEDPKVKAYYAKTGVESSIQLDAYKVGDVSVAIQSSKLAGGAMAGNPMAGMMSELMTQHIAWGEKVGVIGYGSDAKAMVEAHLGGTAKGGLDKAPGVARALKHAAPNPSMMMWVNPIEVGRRLQLNGLNPMVATLKDVRGETGLGVSLGAENNELVLHVDVPGEMAQKTFSAFQQAKGAF